MLILNFFVPIGILCSTVDGSTLITTEMAEAYRNEQLENMGKIVESLNDENLLFSEIREQVPKPKGSSIDESIAPKMAARKYIRMYIDDSSRHIGSLLDEMQKLRDTTNFPISKLRGVIQLDKSATVCLEASRARDAMKSQLQDASITVVMKSALKVKHSSLLSRLNLFMQSPSLTRTQEALSAKITALGNALLESIEHKKAMKAAQQREAERSRLEQLERERQALLRVAEEEARRKAGMELAAQKKAEKAVAQQKAREEKEEAERRKVEQEERERENARIVEGKRVKAQRAAARKQAKKQAAQTSVNKQEETPSTLSESVSPHQEDQDMLLAAINADEDRKTRDDESAREILADAYTRPEETRETNPYMDQRFENPADVYVSVAESIQPTNASQQGDASEKYNNDGNQVQDVTRVAATGDSEHTQLDMQSEEKIEILRSSHEISEGKSADLDQTTSMNIGAALESGQEHVSSSTPTVTNDSEEFDESTYHMVSGDDAVPPSAFDGTICDRPLDETDDDMTWIEVYIQKPGGDISSEENV